MIAYKNIFRATTYLAYKAVTATIKTVLDSAASVANVYEEFSQVTMDEFVFCILPGSYDLDFEECPYPAFPRRVPSSPASPEAPATSQAPISGSFEPLGSRARASEWQTVEPRKSPRRASPSPPATPAPEPASISKFRHVKQRTHGRYREPVHDMDKRLTQGNIYLVLQGC
ncbi:uncharacterized protein CXQ87_001243 [Candidozyma duobushaemuli]|uniref:Uncharacterized protein n=2 Tax=Candidozyma TaxID=3303203 RepID=A0ABX8I0Z8_9ASCO|nr:uncharacterized protein CXQ87_001243 [[Candida] duobushaemulonis]PVH18323.1 hypothetical protein CXQ87_001243 [[Candida] duobushaemulonis]QWU86871.1 hypothetical protein CA3LBN_001089 [[Candida] haemuloni]